MKHPNTYYRQMTELGFEPWSS